MMPMGSGQSVSWRQADGSMTGDSAKAELVVGDQMQISSPGDRCEVRVKGRQSQSQEVWSIIAGESRIKAAQQSGEYGWC